MHLHLTTDLTINFYCLCRGVNVLEKPELKKTFDNRRQTQREKEWDERKKSMTKRSSLEMKLEQRANKLKEVRLYQFCRYKCSDKTWFLQDNAGILFLLLHKNLFGEPSLEPSYEN